MLKTTTPKILAETTQDRLWEQELNYTIHVPLILRNGQAQDGYPECYILSEVNKNKIYCNTTVLAQCYLMAQ